jgi:hypothetical protein
MCQLAAATQGALAGSSLLKRTSMLVMKEQRAAIRTLRGWAISVLLETGAIRECEEHGWMRDRADPHARERALVIARQDPPPGVSPEEAVAELRDVLYSIGDTCPECPPGQRPHMSGAFRSSVLLLKVGEVGRILDRGSWPPAIRGGRSCRSRS